MKQSKNGKESFISTRYLPKQSAFDGTTSKYRITDNIGNYTSEPIEIKGQNSSTNNLRQLLIKSRAEIRTINVLTVIRPFKVKHAKTQESLKNQQYERCLEADPCDIQSPHHTGIFTRSGGYVSD
ncbi:hypothetical protein GJ496_011454 [Pomphorhynchus laevis]|nr:hypothetical protein GJ496_011454 [Pomphorhynchus laevis]